MSRTYFFDPIKTNTIFPRELASFLYVSVSSQIHPEAWSSVVFASTDKNNSLSGRLKVKATPTDFTSGSALFAVKNQTGNNPVTRRNFPTEAVFCYTPISHAYFTSKKNTCMNFIVLNNSSYIEWVELVMCLAFILL